MVLLELPQDILICVLSEWVDVDLNALSQLDVAVSSMVLREGHWLPLLAQLQLKEIHVPPSIQSALSWMHERNLKIQKIDAGMRDVNGLEGVSFPFSFPAALSVSFPWQRSATCNPFGLREFLSLFPSMTALDFTSCSLHDHQLLELIAAPALPLPFLRELDLNNYNHITPASVATLVSYFSSTLEELYCDVLDDCAIKKLGRCCAGMRKIGWSLDAVKDEAVILDFFSRNPNIVFINFQSGNDESNALVTNSFVARVAVLCPQLRDFWLEPSDPVDYYVLPVVFAQCKHLSFVSVRNAYLTLTNGSGGAKHCAANFVSNSDPDCLTSLLEKMTLPVHKLCAVSINRQGLKLLGERNGSCLVTIKLTLSADIERQDMREFIARCPNLLCLKLSGRADVVFGEDLRFLPHQCRGLLELELDGCAKTLTDLDVLAALNGFRGNHMTCLEFYECAALTNAVLDKMDELFPNLQSVAVNDAAVTKERALQFLISRRFSALTSFAAPSSDVQRWIEAQPAFLKAKPYDLTFVDIE